MRYNVIAKIKKTNGFYTAICTETNMVVEGDTIDEVKAKLKDLMEYQSHDEFEIYLENESVPLDDYDYQLAREADEDTDTEMISHEDLRKKLGDNCKNKSRL